MALDQHALGWRGYPRVYGEKNAELYSDERSGYGDAARRMSVGRNRRSRILLQARRAAACAEVRALDAKGGIRLATIPPYMCLRCLL